MNDSWKKGAVEIHDQQAALFHLRYQQLAADPYANTFNYSRKKIDEVLDHYLSTPAPGTRLLDVGCGTGHLLHKLSQRGFACWGCDASQEMLQYARELNRESPIEAGDIEALQYPANFFDAVISIEVMRYMRDIRVGLTEIWRVLKPGGFSLITYAPKFSASLYPLLNQITSRVQLPGFSKVRQSFHAVGELQSAYAEVGFNETRVHARFLGPFVYLRRVAPSLGSWLLRRWEPLDDRISDVSALRNLTNLFVVYALKPL